MNEKNYLTKTTTTVTVEAHLWLASISFSMENQLKQIQISASIECKFVCTLSYVTICGDNSKLAYVSTTLLLIF